MSGKLHARDRVAVPFTIAAADVAQADGKAWVPVPVDDADVVGANMAMDDTGGTSGSTDVMLAARRNGTDVGDILDSAMSIAYDASAYFDEAEESEFNSNAVNLQRGDLVRVDIDAVPGSGSPGPISGVVIFQIRRDR